MKKYLAFAVASISRLRLLRLLLSVAFTIIAIANASALEYDKSVNMFILSNPEDFNTIIGRSFNNAGQIGTPVFSQVIVVDQDNAADVLVTIGTSASSLSAKANILNIFNLGVGAASNDYNVICLAGLRVLRPAEDLPLPIQKVRFVSVAVAADSYVLDKVSNVEDHVTFDASVDNFKHVLQSIGNALFGPKPPPVAAAPSPAPHDITCANADELSQATLKELNTGVIPAPSPSAGPVNTPTPTPASTPSSTPTSIPSPSASPTATPLPSGTPPPTPTASPVPIPTKVPAPEPAPSTSPNAVVLTLDASRKRSLVTYSRAHNVVFAISVLESALEHGTTLGKTTFTFQSSDESSTQWNVNDVDASNHPGDFNLAFTDYAGNSQALHCVLATLTQFSSARNTQFVYCPSRPFIVIDGHHPAPNYRTDTRFSNIVRAGITTQVFLPGDKTTFEVDQNKVTLNQLTFYFTNDGTATSLVRVKGPAALYSGVYSVTRVTKVF